MSKAKEQASLTPYLVILSLLMEGQYNQVRLGRFMEGQYNQVRLGEGPWLEGSR
jgi:hypothetical protein